MTLHNIQCSEGVGRVTAEDELVALLGDLETNASCKVYARL
jgi:hypothetical protein